MFTNLTAQTLNNEIKVIKVLESKFFEYRDEDISKMLGEEARIVWEGEEYARTHLFKADEISKHLETL